jgi:hypothetical protein
MAAAIAVAEPVRAAAADAAHADADIDDLLAEIHALSEAEVRAALQDTYQPGAGADRLREAR